MRGTEQIGTVHTRTQSWRYSLTPLTPLIQLTAPACANDSATPLEILFTTVAIAPPSPGSAAESATHAARYRTVVDSAYDAIVTIDQSHNITLFNRAAENLFGYSAAEILGQRIDALLPQTVRAHHSQNVRKFADSPLTELRQMSPPRMDASNSVFGRHRNGSIIPVEIAISRIDVDGHTEFTAVVRRNQRQLRSPRRRRSVVRARERGREPDR